jgi:hypothetical protein
VAAVALAIVASGCTDRPPFDSEPLSNANPHGWATTMPVGSVFTDGFEVLHLDGHEPAVIKSVTMVGDPGIELVGASIATTERDIGSIQQLKGYPPSNPHIPRIIPAAGASITPFAQDEIGWELLLGIKIVDDGYLVRDGIIIEYSVGGEDRRAFDPAQLVVCTSSAYYRGHSRCPFPWQKARTDPPADSTDTTPTPAVSPAVSRRRSLRPRAGSASAAPRARRAGRQTAPRRRTRRRPDRG